MPPKDESPITPAMGTLYIIAKATGEETPLGPVTSIRTIEADPREDNVVHRINHSPAATFTFTIRSKRMTRKKFVKMLMADGVPRNIANAMAEIVRNNGDTYSWGYLVIGLSGFLPWKEG